jgi:hypothetical protein
MAADSIAPPHGARVLWQQTYRWAACGVYTSASRGSIKIAHNPLGDKRSVYILMICRRPQFKVKVGRGKLKRRNYDSIAVLHFSSGGKRHGRG